MRKWKLNLRLFGEGGGDGAAAAGTGDAGGSSAEFVAGTVLEDGTQVDSRLAERLNRQRKRNPRTAQQIANVAQEGTGTQKQQENIDPTEAEWAEAKKGRFAQLYGRDVQAAVNERFKNQADTQKALEEANSKLDGLQPMLDVLMKKAGVDSVEKLRDTILNDESLYEEEAEAEGMTVEAYKTFKELERRNQQLEQSQKQQRINEHMANLSRQAEELKKTFPNFDLLEEMKDPTFLRLTSPNSGLTLEQVYYAVHHNDINPMIMQAGINKAKAQISQSIQANGTRPVEGAMTNSAAPNIGIDARSMTRAEREKLKERARRGEKIVL